MAIQKVMVVGAGRMGLSLTQCFAQGGFTVYCVDINKGALQTALGLIKSSLLTMEDQGNLEKGGTEAILGNINTFVGFDKIPRDIDLIVEAIYEDETAKKDLFEKIDRTFSLETVIVSNTSYLNVFELANIRKPQRLAIAHWFLPPDIIPIVEVVKGPETSPDTIHKIITLLKKLDKIPILLDTYIPGFVVNRLQRVIGKEIFYLLDNNIISPQDLDKAVKYSLGIRIPVVGVVQRYDYAGLDSALNLQKNKFISKNFGETLSTTLEALVKAGHVGIRSGKGFYEYQGKPQEEIIRDRDIRLRKMKTFLDQLDSIVTQ